MEDEVVDAAIVDIFNCSELSHCTSLDRQSLSKGMIGSNRGCQLWKRVKELSPKDVEAVLTLHSDWLPHLKG